MSKIAKAIILLDYLSEKKRTKLQIANKLEVSERTVVRLIQELSPYFSIEACIGCNGGYYIPSNILLTNGILSKDEITLISEALSAYKNADIKQVEDLRLKLNGKSYKPKNWMIVDFSKWDSSGIMDNLFNDIKKAILDLKQIEFTYFDMYYQKTNRTVNPYWLVFKEHSWYVKGFCLLRNSMRTFKLTKMMNVKILSTSFIFEEKMKQDKDVYYNTKFSIINLVLHIKKELAAKVYEDFDQESIHESDKGYLVVKCTMFKDDKFIPLLLSYGDNINIISPKEVFDEVAYMVKKMYNNYHECLK